MPINDSISRLPTWQERFWARVDKTSSPSGCWVWTGPKKTPWGHCAFSKGNKQRKEWCHRLSYELLVGPIPDGLVIDHLCNNPSCVNPAHLRACTQRENLLRSERTHAGINARKNVCKNGHHFDMTTLKGRRGCKTCAREWAANWRKLNRERVREIWRRSYLKKKGAANEQPSF